MLIALQPIPHRVTIRTTTVTDDTATYCGGYNLVGYIAGFTNIDPGSDGDFTVTVGSDDATNIQQL